ncbi:MAG: SsrA-binding protein SmpB [Clostridia bacterium]|nr:SsrA-binding protein SmpB [Clostridia bacterium]
MKIIAENRKALHDYFIEEKYTAGIVLVGSEVKSIRAGKINLKDSFGIIKGGEVFLVGTNISTYEKTTNLAPDPMRTRKLLLNRSEIDKLDRKVKIKGYSLVPLNVFFEGSLVKVTLALVRGKQNFDKKNTIKEQDIKRETERELKNIK